MCCVHALSAQDELDTQTQKLLIEDKEVQYETTWAIDSTYNYSFAEAEKRYRWLKQKYPDTSSTLSSTFYERIDGKLSSNPKDESHNDTFISYLDSTLYLAKRLYKKKNHRLEATFFLAGAYALKGRFYGERKKWTSASWALKSALSNLEECASYEHLSTELLIGEALYNYYAVWLVENYPRLRFLAMFFKKGNKELGLEQLTKVTQNAFFVRTEAQYFLIDMLRAKGKTEEALMLSDYLVERYPKNALFRVQRLRLLYLAQRYIACRQEAMHIYQQVDTQQIGYGTTQARYACFFLGWSEEHLSKNQTNAYFFYEKAWQYAQTLNLESMGYSLHALLFLAQQDEKNGRLQKAEERYRTLKKWSRKNKKMRKNAKEKIRKIKRKQRKQRKNKS